MVDKHRRIRRLVFWTCALVILATLTRICWVHHTVSMESSLKSTTKIWYQSTDVENDNSKRVHNLRKQCLRSHYNVEEQGYHPNHMMVNDEYKIIFCFIPKISCSEWKNIFIQLTGKVKNTSVLNFGTVHEKYQKVMDFFEQYTNRKKTRIQRQYKKYIFVRNPFERILSAYRNKLAGKGFHSRQFQIIGKHIIRRYRPNANATSLMKGNDVTFLEFVKYLTDEKTTKFNSHWEKYATLCKPCRMKYDFIGKYETVNRDADYVLHDIGVPPHIRFPSRSEKYDAMKTIDTFSDYYSKIPQEYIMKLWEIYKNDFNLFGYSLNDTLRLISGPN